MSWDSYIDQLVGHSSNNIVRGAIIGLDGGAPWTTEAPANAIKWSANEAANIAKGMKSGSIFNEGMSLGIHIGGTKYQILRQMDNKVLFFKKKDHGGGAVQLSKTAIVIGMYGEGMQAGMCNKGVATIAEYLESLGM